MKTKTWLDRVFEGQDLIRNGRAGIESVAYRLRAVGMDKLAEELEMCAEDIYVGSEHIRAAISDSIGGQFQESQNAVGEVLRALLHKDDDT